MVCSPDGDSVFQHCLWSFARRYAYNLSWLRTLNVDRSLVDCSRERPGGSFFNNYYTEV